MIAPEFVMEPQQLNREEQLKVKRLLQDDLVGESSECDELMSEPRRVFKFIPPVRATTEAIEQFEALEKELNTDDCEDGT